MKKGFTAIEFMIVIAIMMLLGSIAVPTFLDARKIAKIQKLGYNSDQATAILKFQRKNKDVSVREAFRIINCNNVPQKDNDNSLAVAMPQLLNSQSDSQSEIGLPNGATDVISVGTDWYTFRWDGHKYLAKIDSINKCSIVCIERLD